MLHKKWILLLESVRHPLFLTVNSWVDPTRVFQQLHWDIIYMPCNSPLQIYKSMFFFIYSFTELSKASSNSLTLDHFCPQKQNKTKLHTPHSYLATFCHHRPEADINFCPSATAPSEHVTCREPHKICPFPSEFFHPKNVERRLSRSQCESSLHSFSLLGNISSDEHTPFYLTIYKLIDIWSVSTFFKNYFEGGYACSCTRFWMDICFILGLHLGLDRWVIR